MNKKQMLRRAVPAVGLAAVAIVTAGCAGGGGADDQTITWWSPNWDTPKAEELVAKFEEQNPDIKVEVVETTNDTMPNKIKTALDSGSGPDVITELVTRVPTYAAKDQLVDLSSWYDADMPVDDFNEAAVDAVSDGDAIYAVPWRWDAQGFIYNKEMFDEAGITEPPATWDELQEDAAILTEKLDVAAYAWPMGSDSNTQSRWLNAYVTHGGTFEEQSDGTISFDADASEAALADLGEGFEEGYVSQASFESDNTALQNLFINKQLAFYSDGAYAIEPITEAGIDVGTAMWPGIDGPATVSANGWSYIVPKASEKQELTKEFLAFMNTPENQADFTLTFPARLSAGENEKFADPLLTPFLEQQNEHGVAAPAYTGYTQMAQTIFSAAQQVGLGQATPAEANKAVVDQAANVLKAD